MLRALDGEVVTFSIVPRTVVRLNGARAAIADIRPGFVARVVHDAEAHALVIAAFGAPVTTTDRGVVTAISRTRDHAAPRGRRQPHPRARMPAPASSSTARRRDGQLARPGAQVAVTHAADAPATVVNVLKRAGA